MIGDLSNDIIAAREAGCPSVHVGWGFGPLPEGLQASGACASSDQLVDIVHELVIGS